LILRDDNNVVVVIGDSAWHDTVMTPCHEDGARTATPTQVAMLR
jgi:hypothetical protein